MDERRQIPCGIWIAALLILVLVVYPLSIGPASFVHVLLGQAEWFDSAARVVYYPIGLLPEVAPASFVELVEKYIEWWVILAESL